MIQEYLEKGYPKEVGIDSRDIINFIKELEDKKVNMHSFILLKNDKIIAESYYAPFNKDTLHRMFSITKSFTSIAIGLLESENKINLDDKIITYFEDKTEGLLINSYMQNLTIRDMLTMSTVHTSTTYKKVSHNDYVKSFFEVEPSHYPGTAFFYDTSSSHTLAALVKKLTGKNILEYLKEKCLDEIGFSKESYVISDPLGISLGGSGLMAKPIDILRFAYLLMKKGNINGIQYLPENYVKEATTIKKNTYAHGNVDAEKYGYGYQFFMTKYDGFCMYGMGGQLALCFPKDDMILVTTADTQDGIEKTQAIFDAFYRNIYDKNCIANNMDMKCENDILNRKVVNDKVMHDDISNMVDIAYGEMQNIMQNLKITEHDILQDYTKLNRLNDTTITFDKNDIGIKDAKIKIHDDYGDITISFGKKKYNIVFGIKDLKEGIFDNYHMRYLSKILIADDNTFIIRVHIIDESVCPLFVELSYNDDKVTIFMKNKDEVFFKEFNGCASGKWQ